MGKLTLTLIAHLFLRMGSTCGYRVTFGTVRRLICANNRTSADRRGAVIS